MRLLEVAQCLQQILSIFFLPSRESGQEVFMQSIPPLHLSTLPKEEKPSVKKSQGADVKMIETQPMVEVGKMRWKMR
jgi:hypothetical protein